jgi:hypothetical protein
MGWSMEIPIDGTVTVMLPDGRSDTVSLTGRVDLRTRLEIEGDETEIQVYARLENVEGVGTRGARYRAFGSRYLEVEQHGPPPLFPPFTLDFVLAQGPPWIQPGGPAVPPNAIKLPITFALQFDENGELIGASAFVGKGEDAHETPSSDAVDAPPCGWGSGR